MNKNIMNIINSLSNEKNIKIENIFKSLEKALEIATKKKYKYIINVRVKINRQSGNFDTFRRWLVVKKVTKPTIEITLDAAKIYDYQIKIGDFIEEKINSIKFDSVLTKIAQKIIIKKVRETEKNKIFNYFNKYNGKIISGVVTKVTNKNLILDVGKNVKAIINRKFILPCENFKYGDNVRGILYSIRQENGFIKLFISRSSIKMLIELFRIEVPEIKNKIIEIKSIVREPGIRSKIAVKSNDIRVDPIGSCIGIYGSRVKSISNELCGERIDIILWDDNPVKFVINAMSPANVYSVVFDEDKHSMNILVGINNLSKAIGRNGQNIRLASKLSGWKLNISILKNKNKT